MKHMTSLRTQYSRCMRTGSTIATTHRQRWLVRKLDFLKPYIKKRLRPSPADHDSAVFRHRYISELCHNLIIANELHGQVVCKQSA